MTTPSPTPPPDAGASPAAVARKPIPTFLLHAAFAALLFWVLPSLDAVYGYAYKEAGNAAFGHPSRAVRVEYAWVPPGERSTPGEIAMSGYVAGRDRAVWQSTYSVRDRGYQPTALLVALVLATPMATRRRIAACVLGGLALNAFFLAQSGFLAASSFAAASEELVPLGAALAAAFPVVKAFFGSPIVRYSAVFATWVVAAQPTRGLDVDAAARWARE
ncbi:MAG: hypothetical protein KC560_00120, partial [Myxococcales bacterium]|nr:hypothetical protein [Myxococcales bacterium]